MTEELKAKMQAGRAAARAARQSLVASSKTEITVPPQSELQTLSERVDRLVDVVDRLAQMVTEKQQVTVTSETKVNLAPDVMLQTMIPSKWQELINKYLGSDFEVTVLEAGSGNYALRVVLPERLDRRAGMRVGRDVSMASPIRRASDVADVEAWCKLISANIRKTYQDFIPKA